MPLILDMSKRRILVVGGGKGAQSKLEALVLFDPALRLVAPQISTAVAQVLAQFTDVETIFRVFQPADLEGCDLVYAYTNDIELNAQILAQGRSRGLWGIAPGADKDFLSPAAGKSGDWIWAISSGGQNISAAVDLRDRVGNWIQEQSQNSARKKEQS